jgi:hypothetical protein
MGKSSCRQRGGLIVARHGLEPATSDMYWDPALSLPGCMGVDDVAIIWVRDVIQVVRGVVTTPVPLAGLATTEIGGEDVVTLETIVLAADNTVVLADVDLGLAASDGWSPESAGPCSSLHPIDGANADLGGVSQTTHDTTWDSTTAYPGCMNVNDLNVITVVE